MEEKKYKLVALLPMKAHSERIKRKNFKNFSGKPLFQWVLDTLLEIKEIEKVIINTDAKHILIEQGLNLDSGRIILRERKKDLCGDYVSMNDVLMDDVININAESYLMTHTTNPLIKCTTIKQAYRKYLDGLKNHSKDSLFTVNKYQTRFYRPDGTAINHDKDNLVRTQDLEGYYEENSNLYIFSQKSFKLNNARIGNKPILFETPRIESIDIDDETGWKLAELIKLSELIISSQS
jgi:CMP-N-acetylneuraminic acid synthetase